jgi:aminoglycoside phosphotransferase (APT) family kinase protein
MSRLPAGVRPQPLADSGYENRIEIVWDSGDLLVRKTFLKRERFLAEVRATRMVETSRLAPRLRSVSENELVLVRDWVPGTAIDLHAVPATTGGPLARLAVCLKHLHGHAAPGWGPLGQPLPSGWLDYLRERLSIRLTQARPVLASGERLRDWALVRMEELCAPDAPVLLHHDLKPENILVSGDRIVLIDFEHATGGDPLSDLAKLKWRTLQRDPRLWRMFFAAYSGRAVDPVAEAAVDFYLAMHCLGALAYGACSGNAAYTPHVRSATRILASLLAARRKR